MGRRLHIPNPIATQYIAWKSLTGYQLRSIQPGLGAFPYASYTTMRSAAGVPRTTAKAVTEDDTAELPTFGVQRGAPVAEPDRLQPGEPVDGGWCCRRGPITVRWRVCSNGP